jgi:hypothetical protein
MGQITRLADIIARLSEFDIDDTIYAREPWTEGSDAMVAREPEPDEEHEYGGLPAPEATAAGLTYFLEIYLARDLVEQLIASSSDDLSASAIYGGVIHYAINDAWD